MKPSKGTVNKLRKLQEYISEEPRRFNMEHWGFSVKDLKQVCKAAKTGGTVLDQYGADDPEITELLAKQKPPCGTVACLAGNAVVMAGLIKPTFTCEYPEEDHPVDIYEFTTGTPSLAAKWLGLSEYDAAPLFYMDDWGYDQCWPKEFGKKYRAAKTFAQKAKIACERIDYFIDTGE